MDIVDIPHDFRGGSAPLQVVLNRISEASTVTIRSTHPPKTNSGISAPRLELRVHILSETSPEARQVLCAKGKRIFFQKGLGPPLFICSIRVDNSTDTCTIYIYIYDYML